MTAGCLPLAADCNVSSKSMDLDDHQELLRQAAVSPARVLRLINGRLYSAEPEEKWSAVRALGALAARPGLLSDEKLSELLRRYFWALNSESGAVPFGLPEAIGELLAVRPALQPDFLPLLCSLAHQPDVFQTGPILRGVLWALGRIGPPAAGADPKALEAVAATAREHPDDEMRRMAAWALARMQPEESQPPPLKLDAPPRRS